MMYWTLRWKKKLCTLWSLVLAKKCCNDINNSRAQVSRLCYLLWLRSQCVILETLYWHAEELTPKLSNSLECTFKYKDTKTMPVTSIHISLMSLSPVLNVFFLVSILHGVLQGDFFIPGVSKKTHPKLKFVCFIFFSVFFFQTFEYH